MPRFPPPNKSTNAQSQPQTHKASTVNHNDVMLSHYYEDKALLETLAHRSPANSSLSNNKSTAKNLVSLVISDDLPTAQKSYLVGLAHEISSSQQFSPTPTHTSSNTSTLPISQGSDDSSPDFTVDIDVVPKSTFIHDQQLKRSGQQASMLSHSLDNFDAQFYFRVLDQLHQLRPGKVHITTHKTSNLASFQSSPSSSIGSQSAASIPAKSDYLAMIYGDNAPASDIASNFDSHPSPIYSGSSADIVPITDQSYLQTRSSPVSTFLLAQTSTFPIGCDCRDNDQLVASGTSESILNEWFDISTTGLPLGHILFFSTISQSTHTLMTNALSRFPALAIYICDAQSLGRGRSANSWVSPPGSLMWNWSTKVLDPSRLILLQYFNCWLIVKGLYFILQHICTCSSCQSLPHNRMNISANTKHDNSIKQQLQAKQQYIALYHEQQDRLRHERILDNTGAIQTAYISPDSLQAEILPPLFDVCVAQVEITIKWPNDIYVNNVKIGGSLVSTLTDICTNGQDQNHHDSLHQHCFAAHIGTGLNLANSAASNIKDEAQKQFAAFSTLNDHIISSYQTQFDQYKQHMKQYQQLFTFKQQKSPEEKQKEQQPDQVASDQIVVTKLTSISQLPQYFGGIDFSRVIVPVELLSSRKALSSLFPTLQFDSLPPVLPLLTREIVLASFTLLLSLTLPVFNQLGMAPFEQEFYRWWLHKKQVVSISSSTTTGIDTSARYEIQGVNWQSGYLIAKNLDAGSDFSVLVELQPDDHSFDVQTMTVKLKKPNTGSPS